MPKGKQPSRRAVLGAAGLAATTSLLPFFRTGPVMAEPGPTRVTPTMATEPVKTASTYYTPARVAATRRNITNWDVVDTWNTLPDPDPDVHVRLTVLNENDDVAVANGYPPLNNPRNPRSLRYVLLHRAGSSLASQFVSVVEPYVGQRFVRSIASVPVDGLGAGLAAHEAAAVRVELVDGRVDYVISCLRPDVTLRVDGRISFRGGFGVVSLRADELEYAYVHDATLLAPAPAGFRPPATVTGQLVDFTRELSAENRLVVRTRGPVPALEQLVGQYVDVANDNERNAAYRVTGASRDASGQLVLDIGTASTIRRYVDDDDFGKGFQYDVAVGAQLRIPLSREWSR